MHDDRGLQTSSSSDTISSLYQSLNELKAVVWNYCERVKVVTVSSSIVETEAPSTEEKLCPGPVDESEDDVVANSHADSIEQELVEALEEPPETDIDKLNTVEIAAGSSHISEVGATSTEGFPVPKLVRKTAKLAKTATWIKLNRN
jgi:hypothetical protein